MRNKIIVLGLLVALSAVAVFAYQTKPDSQQSALPNPSENTSAKLPPTLGTLSAVPDIVAVNTPTPVVITVRADSPLIPSSFDLLRVNSDGSSTIVGRLNDEGKNGDVKAGDKVFTTTLLMNEATAGVVSIQVSAAYHGFGNRIFSQRFNVQVWNKFKDPQGLFSIEFPESLSLNTNAEAFRIQSPDISNQDEEALGPGDLFVDVFSFPLSNDPNYINHINNPETLILPGRMTAYRDTRADAAMSPLPGIDMYVPVGRKVYVVAGTYDGVSDESAQVIKFVQNTFSVGP